jgi:hypothetical protein
MPNLLPDWTQTLPFDLGDWHLRASGRLVWSTFLLIVGIVFVFAVMKPPRLKRPFPTMVGVVLFPVIIIGTLVLGKLLPDYQRTIVWLGIFAVIAHALLMVVSRTPRDPERQATWAECFAGALAAFALFALGYAIVPSEWLTFANSGLEWGDSSKFIFTSHEAILGLGFLPNYPFNVDYPALRDIVVTLIYVVLLGLNLKIFVMWQKRHEVAPETTDAEPAKRSRFGRPLQAWSARRAEAKSPTGASAGVPTAGA